MATLACGLSEDSRSKRRLTGARIKLDTLLIASLVDRVSVLAWRQTRDGQRGKRPPESVVRMLLAPPKVREELAFDSIEAFEAALTAAQHKTDTDKEATHGD